MPHNSSSSILLLLIPLHFPLNWNLWFFIPERGKERWNEDQWGPYGSHARSHDFYLSFSWMTIAWHLTTHSASHQSSLESMRYWEHSSLLHKWRRKKKKKKKFNLLNKHAACHLVALFVVVSGFQLHSFPSSSSSSSFHTLAFQCLNKEFISNVMDGNVSYF